MFKRMLSRMREVDPRYIVCVLLVLSSAALGLFVYQYPAVRLGEAGVDFFKMLAGLFFDIIKREELAPAVTVNEFTKVDLVSLYGIDTAAMGEKIKSVWAQFSVRENMIVYLINDTFPRRFHP